MGAVRQDPLAAGSGPAWEGGGRGWWVGRVPSSPPCPYIDTLCVVGWQVLFVLANQQFDPWGVGNFGWQVLMLLVYRHGRVRLASALATC